MVSGPGHGNVEKAREVAEKQRADAIAAAAEETRLRIEKFGADCERIVELEWVELGSNSFECTCRFTRDLAQGDQLKLPTQLKEGETLPVILILPGERGPILQRAIAHQAAYEAMVASPSWVSVKSLLEKVGCPLSIEPLLNVDAPFRASCRASCHALHAQSHTHRHRAPRRHTSSPPDHLPCRNVPPMTAKSHQAAFKSKSPECHIFSYTVAQFLGIVEPRPSYRWAFAVPLARRATLPRHSPTPWTRQHRPPTPPPPRLLPSTTNGRTASVRSAVHKERARAGKKAGRNAREAMRPAAKGLKSAPLPASGT